MVRRLWAWTHFNPHEPSHWVALALILAAVFSVGMLVTGLFVYIGSESDVTNSLRAILSA